MMMMDSDIATFQSPPPTRKGPPPGPDIALCLCHASAPSWLPPRQGHWTQKAVRIFKWRYNSRYCIDLRDCDMFLWGGTRSRLWYCQCLFIKVKTNTSKTQNGKKIMVKKTNSTALLSFHFFVFMLQKPLVRETWWDVGAAKSSWLWSPY